VLTLRPVFSSTLFHHQAKTVKSEGEEKLWRPTKNQTTSQQSAIQKQDVVATMTSLGQALFSSSSSLEVEGCETPETLLYGWSNQELLSLTPSSFFFLSSNKCSPFSFFFGPGSLRHFVQGVFSLFDDFTMKVFTDSTLKQSVILMAKTTRNSATFSVTDKKCNCMVVIYSL